MSLRAASANSLFRLSLVFSLIIAGVVGLAGGLIGWIGFGPYAAYSLLLGGGLALVFGSLTALSLLWANRFTSSQYYPAILFAAVMGLWLAKMAALIAFILLLRHQPWILGLAFWLGIVLVVVAGLVIDVVLAAKSRLGLSISFARQKQQQARLDEFSALARSQDKA